MEYTVLRSWVEDWLTYVHWYCKVGLSPEVNIEDFFQAPIVTIHWNARREEPELVRFSTLWRLFKRVVSVMGLDWGVPILPATAPIKAWVLGGNCDATNFRVELSGLVQPVVHKKTIKWIRIST